MNETVMILLAGLAGVLLGVLFFGGLWWTVRKGISAKQPALWFLGSLILRMSMTLAGFYFVGGGRWPRLLVCLIGFMVGRMYLTRLIRSPIEVRHALRHFTIAFTHTRPLPLSLRCTVPSPPNSGEKVADRPDEGVFEAGSVQKGPLTLPPPCPPNRLR
jgi:F1F0 ATPase subunit 2